MKRFAIFIDGNGEDAAPIASALTIANRIHSHLDVHHPWARGEGAPDATGKALESADKILESGRSEARQAFHQVCDGHENTKFIGIDGHMSDAIRTVGTVYDLIVIERLDQETGPKAHAFNTALFDTGTPVLITPPVLPQQIGQKVAVVWTGTSQSGRALRSALPFLYAAKEICVLTNTENPVADPVSALEYLAVHGIAASHDTFDGSGLTARGRGRAIIEAVNEMSADMLVMGAFGHNGIERIFDLGRTTRKLVTAAPIPMLLQS
jgi:nucleotide-binding universal stress UspA family protein